MARLSYASLAVACCFSFASAASGQPDKSKLAITDLAFVDEDFHFQGEYLGAVSRYAWGCDYIGLQVVALGGGAFDAVLLPGGLPGAGWDRTTKYRLSGTREEGLLTLMSADHSINVMPPHGALIRNKNDDLAHITKIHRVSATQHIAPPPGAVVLFNGSSTEQFEGGAINAEGLLEVGPLTRMKVGDFRLHLEFRTPYMPYARGQGRGNSGVYIQQRYEVQILDSFGLDGVANECGGLYRQKAPDVNMCLPPLSWQTYDIDFTAARFDSQKNKIAPARITVLHNGVPIHDRYDIIAKTGAGQQEGPDPRPILLQNHGNPVNFRNIWLVPYGDSTNRPAQRTFTPPVQRLPTQKLAVPEYWHSPIQQSWPYCW